MDPASDEDEDDFSLWSRPFTFGSLKVRVEEEWGLGIGGTVWEGGVLLARYISSPAFLRTHRGSRCIEIGAGITALPSIAAAHFGTFEQIVITDIDECIEALTANLTANLPESCKLISSWQAPGSEDEELGSSSPKDGWGVPQSVVDVAVQGLSDRLHLGSGADDIGAVPSDCHQLASDASEQGAVTSHNCSLRAALGQLSPTEAAKTDTSPATMSKRTQVVVRSLDWRDGVSDLELPFDTLLIADVVRSGAYLRSVYIVELMDPLLRCMHALSGPETVVILAYYERSRSASEEFWKLLPKYFSWQKILEESFGASPQPDEVGLFRLQRS